jgi:DNA-binding NtrC family response regulator
VYKKNTEFFVSNFQLIKYNVHQEDPVTGNSGLGGHEVLVVDDSQMVRDYCGFVLGDAGYRVCEASTAVDGLRLLAEHDIGVVISDLHLGRGINGAEFLQQVHKLRPEVLLILISGEDLPSRGANRGVRVLPKPFKPDELLYLLPKISQETDAHGSPDARQAPS